MTKLLPLARLALYLCCLALGCGGGSGNKDSDDGGAGSKGGDSQAGKGLCQGTCDRDCTSDQDCDMANGQMCCDFGAAGKACIAAPQCPIRCTSDTACDTTAGKACVLVDIAQTDKTCTAPGGAVQLCAVDSECKAGNICCALYDRPYCLPPAKCPKACIQSTDCDTVSGEICCTTVRLVEDHVKAAGLCLNPGYATCPKACAQSADCNTTSGEVCCNGMCSKSCPRTCNVSTDCSGQICCKSARTRVPDATVTFSVGPHCAGTPTYSSCASLSTSTCPSVPGCRMNTPPA